jgi:RND family efflux transporter MFP subunit
VFTLSTTAMPALRPLVLFLLAASGPFAALAAPVAGGAPASAPAEAAAARPAAAFDGVVEALRQTVIAAQVAGAVVKLEVKAGDRVRAGQVLLRLDARAADQTAAAGAAQARAAQAAQEVAAKDYERQQLLFAQHFISQAALDHAAAEFRAAQAQAAAQLAQAGAARTLTGFYVVVAPYAGVVSAVPVALGDMAQPGRTLVEMYDPAALRVTAWVPQSAAEAWSGTPLPRVELPGLADSARWPVPTRAEKLPTLDAATHTVQVRADLPPGLQGVAPGLFARLWLPVASGRTPNLWVPSRAVVRRAELAAVYVQGAEGRPLLRQVRLGRTDGDRIEVLAGVMPGERVLSDPQAAARSR